MKFSVEKPGWVLLDNLSSVLAKKSVYRTGFKSVISRMLNLQFIEFYIFFSVTVTSKCGPNFKLIINTFLLFSHFKMQTPHSDILLSNLFFPAVNVPHSVEKFMNR